MLLRLLQFASPMLPIGAFSYSSGLESAIESGDVHDAESGAQWIGSVLEWNLARQDGPLAAAAHSAWSALGASQMAQLKQLNDLAFATRETSELRLESTQTGHSLAVWIERTLDPTEHFRDALEALRPIAYPIAWAAGGVQLQLSPRDTVLGMLWGFVENQASALMKALPLGQTPAQRMMLALGPRIERATDEALERSVDIVQGAAGAMPALAIASMHHETQYSRLFRS
jgi:urease accessory protein